MIQTRVERLQALMVEREIDAVAIIPGANLFYLTGLQMRASERVTLALFEKSGKGSLLLPTLEAARAESQLRIPMMIYTWGDAEGTQAAWKRLKTNVNLDDKTIAVEYLNLRVLELDELRAFAPRFNEADASKLLAELRMVKDPGELEAMRAAARLIDRSLEELIAQIHIGQTEEEVAAAWQLAMKRCGADTIPEEPIVASGPNSAAPHTTATGRSFERGDLVILDGWCQVSGYFTDITRTISIGEPSAEMRRVYETVRQANVAGRERVAPGVTAAEIDQAAREVIERAGLGQYFIHRTGHGLGLEVHEPPSLVAGNSLRLEPGMTFTVEPGIYIPGQGGVRIEDDVVVTQDGVETLTAFPHELLVI